MRHTKVAVTSIALIGALSACASPGAGPGHAGTAGSGPAKPFTDAAALTSATTSAMQEKQTVEIDLPGPSGTGEMACQVDIGKAQEHCAGGPIEIVTTQQALYVKKPGANPSKPWTEMKIDPNSPMGKVLAQQQSSFQKFTNAKQMLPEGTTITSSAPDQVDGKSATRYETVLDVNKAASQGDDATKQVAQELLKAGVQQVKQRIWLGSDNLPVKAESDTPAMNVAGHQLPQRTTTVTYKNWGAPVTITVPPADQVQVQAGLPGLGN